MTVLGFEPSLLGMDDSQSVAGLNEIVDKKGKTAGRSRRKARWKLKFHHQALPPEYLKHYRQQERKRKHQEDKKRREPEEMVKKTIAEALPGGLNIDLSQNKAFLENLLTNQIAINRVEPEKPKKILNVEDLPFMGEITLDGVKPRRGRKPKKADICHLIYKNYGQVFPGSTVAEERAKVPTPSASPLPTIPGLINHSQVQHRIISSLLERRLTRSPEKTEEPLNLCLKDLQSLRLRLSRKGDVYESKMAESEEEEDEEEEELAPFNLVSAELGESSDNNSADESLVTDKVPLKKTDVAQVVAKRKRSAIFIPPVPAENTANPATEVSICKFKFTGGARPSLQEKKMLSVDAGGNFRYYSGTGDKSSRGYEFYPRDALQQCQQDTGCSPAGVFLTASALGTGERIPDHLGQSGFFDADLPLSCVLPKEKHHVKKSRRSLAREQLEQTFKEKGFLIQTQHVQSAEGATYCKFRQLRKFTRYLFRSWKDYLPNGLHDLTSSEPPKSTTWPT